MNSKEDFLTHCREFFIDSDFKKLMRILKNYENSPQYDDFFAEIVVGLYLRKLGLDAKPSIKVRGLTPDWVIFDYDHEIIGTVEVAHLHIDYQTDQELLEQEKKNKGNEPFIITYWMDGNADNSIRLFNILSKKATKYKKLSNEEKIPLVIATYINAKLTFFEDEIEDLLFNNDNSIFSIFDFIDGVLIIHEVGNSFFEIRYRGNPKKLNELNLPKNYNLTIR